jgi:hypothetical protein
VKVQKFEAMSAEGEKYRIFLTPAVMIEDKVISAGRGISEKDIEKAVIRALKDIK